MPRCIRCGRLSTPGEEEDGTWLAVAIIDNSDRRDTSCRGHIIPFRWLSSDRFVSVKTEGSPSKYIGLCPDCQIKTYKRPLWIENLEGKRCEEVSEKAYKNLLGCITMIQKRIENIEKEQKKMNERLERNYLY